MTPFCVVREKMDRPFTGLMDLFSLGPCVKKGISLSLMIVRKCLIL